jgi:hypothetical protein
MFKKIAITAVAVAAGLFILHSTRLGSYARTAFGKFGHCIENQITPEFELENAKRELAELGPEIRKQLTAIAREKVAVETLRKDIEGLRVDLEKRKDTVRVMRDQLASGDQKVSRGDRILTREQLRKSLDRELNACKKAAENLLISEKTLEAREEGLNLAQQQFESMKHQQGELQVQIAELEAELKALKLAQTRSTIKLDDSKLANVKASLERVRNKIKEEREVARMEQELSDGQTIGVKKEKSAKEVIQEANAVLGEKDSKVVEK